MKLKRNGVASGTIWGLSIFILPCNLMRGFSQAGQFIMDFVQINCIPIFWPTLSLILIDTQWIMCKYFHAIFRHLGSLLSRNERKDQIWLKGDSSRECLRLNPLSSPKVSNKKTTSERMKGGLLFVVTTLRQKTEYKL